MISKIDRDNDRDDDATPPPPPPPHHYAGTEWSPLFQGAESRVYRGEYYSKPAILKERFAKTYRLPELDQKLTKERMRSELKAYEKIGKKCPQLAARMPTVLYSDERNIVLTEIREAISVREYFNRNQRETSGGVGDNDADDDDLTRKMLRKMGEVVGQIHSCGLVHGDLTTSNFLISKTSKKTKETTDKTEVDTEDDEVIPIDFGLSLSSASDEDRAVDLYVLERAIQSTHPKIDFTHLLESYRETMGTDRVIKRLEQVRQRGRKRLMIG